LGLISSREKGVVNTQSAGQNEGRDMGRGRKKEKDHENERNCGGGKNLNVEKERNRGNFLRKHRKGSNYQKKKKYNKRKVQETLKDLEQ